MSALLHLLLRVLQVLRQLPRDGLEGHERLDLPLDEAEEGHVVHHAIQFFIGVGLCLPLRLSVRESSVPQWPITWHAGACL